MSSISTELWLYWLQLAARHTAMARQQRERSLIGHIGPDKIRATLEELTQSMVSISCAASSVDGFGAAIRDVTGQAPPGKVPRSKQALALIASGLDISASEASWEADLEWLFTARNALVHADPRNDPTWRHPSGISVAAIASEVNVEAAERALQIAREVIIRSLDGTPKMPEGVAWVALRRGRAKEALAG